jgi:hypothetical protein
MDLTQLIPYPDILPAPWWLFYALLIFTFILHLLATNAMLGLAIIAWADGLGGHGGPIMPAWRRDLARFIPWTIALSVNLGVAPLLFLQVIYGQFGYASSVMTAVFWLSIFVLIILGYYAAYVYDFTFDRLGPIRHWAIGFSALCFVVAGFFFTHYLLVMLNPWQWPRYFSNPDGLLFSSADPSLWPRFLHLLVSSVAVGGLVLALWARWHGRSGDPEAEALVSRGLTWYGVMTLINFGVGVWYMGSLPNETLRHVIFEDRFMAVVFICGVASGIGSIPAAFSRHITMTTIFCLMSVSLMILFRFAIRGVYLAPYLKLEKLPVATEWSPAIMFGVVLVAGITSVAYMLKLALNRSKEAQT